MKALSIRYEDIIKNRSVWMGIAIIMVCILHYMDGNSLIVYTIKGFCQGAVDIFFFASGIGCYHSLHNNSNIWDFFKKRIQRVYFVWLPFIIIYMIFTTVLGEKYNLFQVIGNLFCVGARAGVGNAFNWYESALWIFYILVPLLVSFVDSNQKKPIFLFIGFLVLFLLSVCYFGDENGIITFSRIPNAYIGVICASIGSQKRVINVKHISCLWASSLIGLLLMEYFNLYTRSLLWDYGLYWYPFILVVPGLCVFFSMAANKLQKFFAPISYIGKNSYEIYLIHVALYDIVFRRLTNYTNCIEKNTSTFIVLSFILSITLGILYKKLFTYIMAKFSQFTHG